MKAGLMTENGRIGNDEPPEPARRLFGIAISLSKSCRSEQDQNGPFFPIDLVCFHSSAPSGAVRRACRGRSSHRLPMPASAAMTASGMSPSPPPAAIAARATASPSPSPAAGCRPPAAAGCPARSIVAVLSRSRSRSAPPTLPAAAGSAAQPGQARGRASFPETSAAAPGRRRGTENKTARRRSGRAVELSVLKSCAQRGASTMTT